MNIGLRGFFVVWRCPAFANASKFFWGHSWEHAQRNGGMVENAPMAKKILPLTDTRCRQAKHSPSGGNKIFDGDGLYLELMPSGAKKWRFKYRHAGKENRLTFGDYPEAGLAAARDRKEAARAQLAAGLDPAIERTLAKQQLVQARADTFWALAEE